ncbi:hypothetical protein CIHG_04123 [Coccidioides immitis H538.4]|uniref:Uncharacterized protein n=3 Tax=Coccidioides immitis TaxID=5501 RepID=A0A0J8R0Z0_COCIT|nr:hypothetical protein CIRG_04518 [Coccidioides immitis RMSCC 2394]KMU78401.1 hypothetical protein CISG_07118 [Coccidioides immitis RMSCC 3703]KMU86334.1 hypothetical protein CIHG_04123 [Coccidioides immitis H538.4]
MSCRVQKHGLAEGYATEFIVPAEGIRPTPAMILRHIPHPRDGNPIAQDASSRNGNTTSHRHLKIVPNAGKALRHLAGCSQRSETLFIFTTTPYISSPYAYATQIRDPETPQKKQPSLHPGPARPFFAPLMVPTFEGSPSVAEPGFTTRIQKRKITNYNHGRRNVVDRDETRTVSALVEMKTSLTFCMFNRKSKTEQKSDRCAPSQESHKTQFHLPAISINADSQGNKSDRHDHGPSPA